MKNNIYFVWSTDYMCVVIASTHGKARALGATEFGHDFTDITSVYKVGTADGYEPCVLSPDEQEFFFSYEPDKEYEY